MEFFDTIPTPTVPNAHKWHKVADQLRVNKGKWAVVEVAYNGKRADNVMGYIRTGKSKAFQPAGSFEAIRDVEGNIWARYVGEDN